ncbi:Myo-inositol-1-phosphate synthase [Marasmius sp. AFHP31]|nr:Myo-inositol-1-phosphate synthase [Marasmius sp. AFHP31]
MDKATRCKQFLPSTGIRVLLFVFIAANGKERAENAIPDTERQTHLEHTVIYKSEKTKELDRVVMFSTMNTNRIISGVNHSVGSLNPLRTSHSGVSASTLLGIAVTLDGEPCDGAPHKVFVPYVMPAPCIHRRGGSQVWLDEAEVGSVRLVNVGIKPLSIASYSRFGVDPLLAYGSITDLAILLTCLQYHKGSEACMPFKVPSLLNVEGALGQARP